MRMAGQVLPQPLGLWALPTIAALLRRGIHHRLQVVVAGAYDDGPRRPRHALAALHQRIRCTLRGAHVGQGLAHAAAAHDDKGLQQTRARVVDQSGLGRDGGYQAWMVEATASGTQYLHAGYGSLLDHLCHGSLLSGSSSHGQGRSPGPVERRRQRTRGEGVSGAPLSCTDLVL